MNKFTGEYICGNKFKDLADCEFLPTPTIQTTGKIIYCKTDYIHDLYEHLIVLDKYQPNKQFTVISHNSDHGIDDTFAAKVPNCVKYWYAQNCNTDHPKFTNIPIGLANPEWPHGDFSPIQRLIDSPPAKKNLSYYCASSWTNPGVRIQEQALSRNVFGCLCREGNVPRDQYIQEMAESVFVFCPLGNGIDTCRLWEALYLGCIPIVQLNKATEQWRGMPILFYKEEKRSELFRTMQNKDFWARRLEVFDRQPWYDREDYRDMNYWRDRILKDS